jgi:hypothetical protein
MIKAASFYRLSSGVKKSPRLAEAAETGSPAAQRNSVRTARMAGSHLGYSVRQFLELERIEWFNSSLLHTGIDKY